MKRFIPLIIVLIIGFTCCNNTGKTNISVSGNVNATTKDTTIYPGIYQTEQYLKLIEGKKIGIVSNQTGVINGVHLADTLIALKQNVVKVFCPEHGFRGTADAGAKVDNSTDPKTGLPIISLYGKNKKPTAQQLADIEVVVFDLQDVGVMYYNNI